MAPAKHIKNLFGHLQSLVSRSRQPDDPRLAKVCEKFRRHNKKRILAQPIEESRFIIIDTETTGFHVYAGDEMVSIAMLEYKGLNATGREYLQLVNPQRPIPEESTAIHGICDDDVADSPPISDVLADIAEFIDDAVLIGHHVNFDIRFLNKYFKREIKCQLRNPYLDTMLLFTSHTGRIGQYSLEEVADCCKIKVIDRHTARGDALMAGGIFTCLAPMLSLPHDDVNHLYNQQFSHDPIKHEIAP